MAVLNAIGIAVSDMQASIRFYRLLGLDVPDDPGDGHVDIPLPEGGRLMLDSEDVIRSFTARLDADERQPGKPGLRV